VVILLAVGVALDLLIGVSLVLQNRRIEHAASSAHISRVAAYQACLNGNTFRSADAKRWADILALLGDGNRDPGLTHFVAGVVVANRVADHPVDCVPLRP
jgi:hypothetical protein